MEPLQDSLERRDIAAARLILESAIAKQKAKDTTATRTSRNLHVAETGTAAGKAAPPAPSAHPSRLNTSAQLLRPRNELPNPRRVPHPRSPSRIPRLTASVSLPDMPGRLSQSDVLDHFRMVQSFAGFEPVGGDTQPMDSQIYKNYISEQETSRLSFTNDTTNTEDITLPRTLNTGDTGHVNLLADFEDDMSSIAGGETQKSLDIEPSPETQIRRGDSSEKQYGDQESQFLAPKTPAMSFGKKRDARGNVVGETPRTSSTTPGSGLTALLGGHAGGNLLSLSQVFHATQAPSSPLPGHLKSDPIFQRPSPHFVRPGPTSPLNLSSPAKPIQSEPSRATTEPLSTYRSMKESQEERNRRQRELEDLRMPRSDDDEIDEMMGTQDIRAAQRQKQKEMKERALRDLDKVTEPRQKSGAAAAKSRMTSSALGLVTPARHGQDREVVVIPDKTPNVDGDEGSSEEDDDESSPKARMESVTSPDYAAVQVPMTSSRPNAHRSQQSADSQQQDHLASPTKLHSQMDGVRDRVDPTPFNDGEQVAVADSQGQYGAPQDPFPPRSHHPDASSLGSQTRVPNSQFSSISTETRHRLRLKIQEDVDSSSIPKPPAADLSQALSGLPEQRMPSSPPFLPEDDAGGDEDVFDEEREFGVVDDVQLVHNDEDQDIQDANNSTKVRDGKDKSEDHDASTQKSNTARRQDTCSHAQPSLPAADTALNKHLDNSLLSTVNFSADATNNSQSGQTVFHTANAYTPPLAQYKTSTNSPGQPPHDEPGTPTFTPSQTSRAQPNVNAHSTVEGQFRTLTEIAASPSSLQSPGTKMDRVSFDVTTASDEDFIATMNQSKRSGRLLSGKRVQTYKKRPQAMPESTASGDEVAHAVQAGRKRAHKQLDEGTESSAESDDDPVRPPVQKRRRIQKLAGGRTNPEDIGPPPRPPRAGRREPRTARDSKSNETEPSPAIGASSTRSEPASATMEDVPARRTRGAATRFSLEIAETLQRSNGTSSPIVDSHEHASNADLRGQAEDLRAESADGGEGDSSSGSVLFPNRVWALFRDITSRYFPATCLGAAPHSDGARLKIRFDDGSIDPELEVHNVRSLELNAGDIVKVDLPDMRTKSYVIKGFKDRIVANTGPTSSQADSEAEKHPITDQRGHRTLILGVKNPDGNLPTTEEDVDVSMEFVYITRLMWRQWKSRIYKYTPETSVMAPPARVYTPTVSTPTTPRSRSRRQTNAFPSHLRDASTVSSSRQQDSSLFANMAFAVTLDERNTENKQLTVRAINANGGQVLGSDGFVELFDFVTYSKQALNESPDPASLVSLNPLANSLGFVALISDTHTRRFKFMQALALNLPCLSYRWILDSIAEKAVLPWEKYLLPAGESSLLASAVRSRVLAPYEHDSSEGRFAAVVDRRSKLLEGKHVLRVSKGRGKGKTAYMTEKQKSYLFLTCALGAQSVERVDDIDAAKEMLGVEEGRGEWNMVYMAEATKESGDVQEAEEELKGENARGLLGVKVVDDEFVAQSLILGALFR
ncbi:hypothetical protein K402DRAFT_221889 [Aulographum hederae CBS 113979]|uniref:BRCT domain-containing protein n=1 Tax=Aulographum hederae CBS 113979 TaxID=1176131 RepID=A0A6G1GLP1_9PEZI|nr:hypothetical protein K402DRAFT_221889 [Aulographum hederae CBS 113979]